MYGLLVLLALGFTSVVLALPEYVRPFVNDLSSLRQMPRPHSLQQGRQSMIDADRTVAAAQAEVPEGVLRWLETPGDETGCYRINLWLPGDPSYRFPRSNVRVDAYSSRVQAVSNYGDNSPDETFLAWQHPLYNGEALGL